MPVPEASAERLEEIVNIESRRKKMKKFGGVNPQKMGNIGKKVRALRKNKNLRFKELYHPPDPCVLSIFCFVCAFFVIFFHFFLPQPNTSYRNVKANVHSEL